MSRTLVVKVGSSTVTTPAGETDEAVVGRLCDEIAGLRRDGRPGGGGDLGGHRRRLVGAGPRRPPSDRPGGAPGGLGRRASTG